MKSFAMFVVFRILLVWSSSFQTENKGRIIGGNDAAAGQFPFMAAINVTTLTSRFFCNGALVNYRWVVTSGTCVKNATLFTISLGSVFLRGDDAAIFASSISEVHPDYDESTLKNDIGLIRFRMEIAETDYIKSLYFYPLPIDSGTEAFAMGWGQISDLTSTFPDRLKYVNVTVLTNEVCRVYYGAQITESMMCVAGSNNEGTCQGDTGSPLTFIRFDSFYIMGVSSFVSGSGCESTEPSGFTRTQSHYDWINSYVYEIYPPDERF